MLVEMPYFRFESFKLLCRVSSTTSAAGRPLCYVCHLCTYHLYV